MPPNTEFETIHYTITAHGTLRVAKDPEKKKSHKHQRRHRNKRGSNEVEKPENEEIETRLHARMTPGPPHASASNAPMIMPVSQQYAHPTAMRMPESGAERAVPRAIATTSKQGTYRRARAETIFPLLSWDEIWAEEKPELPGSNNPYRTEQNLSTAAPAQASATGNSQRAGRANEFDTRRKSASVESVPRVNVQPPARLTKALQGPESSGGSTEGTNISCELPTRTRGKLQNQTNGHGHPVASGTPLPPPHRIMTPRRQTLGPLLLSVQVEEYDKGSRRNDVEYEVSGQGVDKRGKALYRLQERRSGGNWSSREDSATFEILNQMESNLNSLEPHPKSENEPPTNKGLTRQTRQIEFGKGPSYRSMEYGRVEPLVGDSTPRQGSQLRKSPGSWGLRGTTLTTDQRTMDTNISPPHNSLASMQTQSLPQNPPILNSAWLSSPLSHQFGPLEEPMPNKKKVIPAQTTPTRDAPRFQENTLIFNSPRSVYTFNTSSLLTQGPPAQVAAARDNSTRRCRPVWQYSDFDLQSSDSDERRFRGYSSVSSFDTIAIQPSPARRALPVSSNTTPQRGVIDTERRGYLHDIKETGHDGAPAVHGGTYVGAPIHASALSTPTRPPKGPAPAFEGIVDLDPGVTLFRTATGMVKSDISPKVALGSTTSAERMLRIWNRKTSDDGEMRELCEAEMRRLQRT